MYSLIAVLLCVAYGFIQYRAAHCLDKFPWYLSGNLIMPLLVISIIMIFTRRNRTNGLR